MNDLTGCLIKATAPRRRALAGVVLPPTPRSRKGRLRLASTDGGMITFDPAQWTITVQAGPSYGRDDLPAELLATRTMLRAEKRRRPATGQPAIAEYRIRDGIALLYAVADTEPLPELPPARAEAWTAARTCHRCNNQRPRPLPEHADGNRYCAACCSAVADERWVEQSRQAQADAKTWARAVLDDSSAMLITHDRGWNVRHFRVETIAGTVVLDARIRDKYAIDPATCIGATADEIEAWNKTNAGTVGHDDIADIAAALAASRLIGWYDADVSTLHWPETVSLKIAAGDVVSQRLALFSGVAPPRFGPWYREPKLPWDYPPPTYPPYTQHRERREGDNRAADLRSLRMIIYLMANHAAPDPTPVRREIRRTSA